MKCAGYWGKTDAGHFHRLLHHNLDVTCCAIRLVERSDRLAQSLMGMLEIPRAHLVNLLAWAALLHDLGKLSPTFQHQSKDTSLIAQALGVKTLAQQYDVRHDSLGWALWQDISAKLQLPVHVLDSMDTLMRCATGHHGKPPSNVKNGTRVSVKRYFGPPDIEAAEELLDWSLRRFGGTLPDHKLIEKASWWIAGVITLADWMGSNRDWFPFCEDELEVEGYFVAALAQADKAIDESGVVMPSQQKSFTELFSGYIPTSVQEAVLALPTTRGPFFLAIEETTGGGKTEAALAAAAGGSFFFGLPTMATANGLWRRVKLLDGQQSLLHGKRWMMPDAMDRATAWLNDSSRRSLLSDIGVGTVDQAMTAAMYARYSTLRLAGLAGKTLIIDEVHAYDVYMKRILEVLIELHARACGSVIILSATLPLKHRQDYANAWCRGRALTQPSLERGGFPLITFISPGGVVSENQDLKSRYETGSKDADVVHSGRHLSIVHVHTLDEVVERIAAEARSGRCVAWIRNTVGEAIDSFDCLLSKGLDVQLFHSRFSAGDRRSIEDAVMNDFGKTSNASARAGKVLVATQVIEQSLDIDFDFMVTDLCPVDLLIQRAGRLHRHEHRGNRGAPVLAVYSPPWTDAPAADWVSKWSKGSAFVYQDHAALWKTVSLIGDGFLLPQDSRKLVEGVYSPGLLATPSGLSQQARRYIGQELARAAQGQMAAIKPGIPYQSDGVPLWDDAVAPTRLGETVVEWVLFNNGSLVNGDIPQSTIQVRASVISTAPPASVKVGRWQKTLNLTDGSANCTSVIGPKTVHYDAVRGLVYR
jgi:CRISPR-associated endonuclease/helicase Cas3